MRPFSYHNHTVFCDGKSTVDEMVRSAIDNGCDAIGFSGHSLVKFEPEYAMPIEKISEYRASVLEAKEKYKEKINVFLGIELDIESDVSLYSDEYDYKIGSVHSVSRNGEDHSIDASRERFIKIVDEAYGGDAYTLCEDYFESISRIYEVTGCDIVGHIDLVTKFNENGEFFDENNERYVAAAEKAIKKLLREDVIFEINTGAMSRGCRTKPYPAKRFLELIAREGGRVTYSSDCHEAKDIICAYDEAVRLAKDCGFEGFMKLVDGEFRLVRFDD